MKIVRFEHSGHERWGVVDADLVVPIPGDDSFHVAIENARNLRVDDAVALSTVKLVAPVRRDAKIICAGLNYRGHLQEMKRDLPTHPSIFLRFPDSFVGNAENVIRPRVTDSFDYEAELAVVIGKEARYVANSEALDYVAGYTCMAENSARDFQKHNTQATPGKNFDRSGAIGPWIVTADEIPDPSRLTLIGRLNGDEVQRTGTDDLIFSVSHLIEYISSFTTLYPGDVIATGTPDGIGMTRTPPRYLKEGDTFEVEIDSIGTLINYVINENRRGK
ncbi:2-keto-4-pentenoate hydratase/2-oxohepta-3-ene-1,7-dioic acid hydratase in catechol pathway [Paraburkholderia sp. BL23I1N1]|uniref:fumarylacetoacetate hydrolase family protein n=1 Tax=Paraburkholderia sp. BL23I1N1 TaxID=1938802 RepID=UPI000E74D02E|nr:fumarylacetoacetate hydrolase family protein [Paraburkholderia sp. BL23I1N1]RKE38652.1 2-keto-4-pentenoate hydratase/2-oxohepta-3-ene-1,7-dioic acid hydratase in catechol pathway [Paraburkholderia sp. BL23I1N1]